MTTASSKILIIKLGAMGDVVRTTPLLRILKGEICWVTAKESIPLLPNDDSIISGIVDIKNVEDKLKKIDFDLVISLDDDLQAARLASVVKKNNLIGSYIDKTERLNYTDNSSSWFDMGLISRFGKDKADALKKANTKSYQEIIFGMLGNKFQGEECLLNIKGAPCEKGGQGLLIGIEERAGQRWPSKKWNKFSELKSILAKEGIKVKVFQQRPSVSEYIKDINQCDLVVTGDTLALHIALALKIKVVSIFTCTSPEEIFGYERMIKVVSPLLDKAFYSGEYCFEAVDAVSVDNVYNAIKKLISLEL